jgi:MOSC domain-containing protein YiiM
MWEGQVVAIHLHAAKSRGQPLHGVRQAKAVAGYGLEGDSYFRQTDTPVPDKEITLITMEALEALEREFGVSLTVAQSRRNLAIHGVPLNDLVGRAFHVGDVVLEGIRLCEPCAHLAGLTDPQVLPGLKGRGGLRARIVQGGEIRVGDAVRPHAS